MFAQSPTELAVLPRHPVSCQKGLPGVKPPDFQTTMSQVENLSKMPQELVAMHTVPSCGQDPVLPVHYAK